MRIRLSYMYEWGYVLKKEDALYAETGHLSNREAILYRQKWSPICSLIYLGGDPLQANAATM